MIDDEDWVKIENDNASDLETWGPRNDLSTGRMWRNMDLALKLNRQRTGACEGTVSIGASPTLEMAKWERKGQSQTKEEVGHDRFQDGR